ncbi:histidinol-phosphate transaminase [Telluribacter sp.]|jgi:histidinol-phosphate aminotransferase|uniref:histidinol-phosphate transaminase n=1 Tax=Telluribacter sp. TaxID=1978767 RepID=UPI002E1580A8|nr:histidinol-phosphate transaminase [Telluribacter sp.]
MDKNFSLSSIIRPHILTLTPYSSARDEYTGTEGIFLDANENPIGSVVAESYNRYPDPYQADIKHKLAPLKGVRPAQLFLGNGSDEPIDLLVRASCTPGQDRILIMPPTYGMYEVSASINDVPITKVPLTPDFMVDTEAVLAAITPETKIVWVCSPNNPTANLVQADAVFTLLKEFNGLVVVDEAYIDFASTESWTRHLDEYPNLVVLQTFSKAWGLASLRLGMCFASEELIRILNKIKPPYNISGPTQQLLLNALDEVENKNQMVREVLHERDLLRTMLTGLPLVKKVHPSDANFLLVQFDEAKEVMNYLLSEKIIVRDRSRVILCEGCLRITVGTRQENETLVETLKKYQQKTVAA